MKKIIGGLSTIILSFVIVFLTSCADRTETVRAEEEKSMQQKLQSEADYAMANTHYVKDPRTSLCFLYSLVRGGAALATVPCDAIPPNLIIVADINRLE